MCNTCGCKSAEELGAESWNYYVPDKTQKQYETDIKRFKKIARKYGFKAYFMGDGRVLLPTRMILQAKNTDGEWTDWFTVNLDSGKLMVIGNTDHLNLWFYRTRRDMTPRKLVRFVKEINAFITSVKPHVLVRHLIDPEDYQELKGTPNDAYDDERYFMGAEEFEAETFESPKPQLTKNQMELLNHIKVSTFHGGGKDAYVKTDRKGWDGFKPQIVQKLLDKRIITIPKHYGRIESLKAYTVMLNPIAWEYPFKYDWDKSLKQKGNKIVRNKRIHREETARKLEEKRRRDNMTFDEVYAELFGAEAFDETYRMKGATKSLISDVLRKHGYDDFNELESENLKFLLYDVFIEGMEMGMESASYNAEEFGAEQTLYWSHKRDKECSYCGYGENHKAALLSDDGKLFSCYKCNSYPNEEEMVALYDAEEFEAEGEPTISYWQLSKSGPFNSSEANISVDFEGRKFGGKLSEFDDEGNQVFGAEEVPEGFHRMPDGTIMADSAHVAESAEGFEATKGMDTYAQPLEELKIKPTKTKVGILLASIVAGGLWYSNKMKE